MATKVDTTSLDYWAYGAPFKLLKKPSEPTTSGTIDLATWTKGAPVVELMQTEDAVLENFSITLRPDGDDTGITPVWAAPGDLFESVDDDGHADFINTAQEEDNGDDGRDYLTFEDLPDGAISVKYITLYWDASCFGGASARISAGWRAGTDAGTQIDSGASYTQTEGVVREWIDYIYRDHWTDGEKAAKHPTGKTLWSIAEFNAIMVAPISKALVSASSNRVHSMWLDVIYEAFEVSEGTISRYHDLSGMGGVGNMNRNPMD